MSQAEATAWWSEVEELRERIERRRNQQTNSPRIEPLRVVPAEPEPAERATRTRRVETSMGATPVRRTSDAAASDAVAPGARRTVRIRGQAIPTVVAPRLRPVDEPAEGHMNVTTSRSRDAARPYGTSGRARPRQRPIERAGANPDRLAAWAFALALLTLLVAAISAHGL
jgi:hypothetical protein